MHTGSAWRETPAAPALFLRGALLRLRLAILLLAVSPMIPGPYGASQGSGNTRFDTPAPPIATRSIPSIRLLTFFREPVPTWRAGNSGRIQPGLGIRGDWLWT